jgi:predicted HicB family RNase H-like nuclease
MTKKRTTPSFPLRMPKSTREQAIEMATREGISLNQFVSMAVAEKIVRLETPSAERS